MPSKIKDPLSGTMNSGIAALAALAMQAQKRRDILKLRFGLNDYQIDVMIQARQPTLRGMPGTPTTGR